MRIAIFTLLLFSPAVLSAETYRFQYEHVLGTSLELSVECETAEMAARAESIALAEIDRLSTILSHYDGQSEIRRLTDASVSSDWLDVSAELMDVLQAAENWRQRTAGAFDIRAGGLADLWERTPDSVGVPTIEQRRRAIESLSKPAFHLRDGKLQRLDAVAISLDGIAKGYILDQVTDRIMRAGEVRGCVLNIGGDIRHRGDVDRLVSIDDPRRPDESSLPFENLELPADVSICTSGNYRRKNHIFDPRSGLPVGHVVSASVIANRAIDADALATALAVLPVDNGIELIEALPDTACLLVLADGRIQRSSNWPAVSKTQWVNNSKAASPSGLHVDFTLARPTGGPYRRPYVAVWLEDEEDFPVKTAVLWLQTESPGPRWHRDLTRWYRNDRLRKTVEKDDMIGSVSGATRGPGEYAAHFDGTDNLGTPLPPGKYTLCLEAAREHGTHKLIRETIELGDRDIDPNELEGNTEISKIVYRYVVPENTDKTNID